MKCYSLRDLQYLPQFKGYNEVEIIHPSSNQLVLDAIWELGIDTDFAVQYLPSKHRSLDNKVAVGYRIVGEIRCDRKFVNSGFCTTEDLLAISSYTDRSLTRELAEKLGTSLDYNMLTDNSNNDIVDNTYAFEAEYMEPDVAEVTAQIKLLERVRDDLRGSMYAEDGSVALWPEQLLTK